MDYDVAFEGGGAKGAVFVGALIEFEARGHTVRRLVGTSAGAVMATLVAAGYRGVELAEALDEQMADGSSRMGSFLDVPEGFDPDEIQQSAIQQLFDRVDIPLVPAAAEARLERGLLEGALRLAPFRMLFSLLERGGAYAGDRLAAWITDKLEDRAPGLGAATFAELAAFGGRDLSITVSDTTGEEMLVLNARTAPDCPVAAAARASMAIPFVFQEVVWQKSWGRYRGRDVTGHVLIDGGVLSNFPIRLLASKLGEIHEIMGDTDPFAAENLGLLIDETLTVDGVEPVPGVLSGLFELRPLRRVERIVETLINAHDRAVIEACMAMGEICRLPAKGYSALEFGMSSDRRRALIEGGRRAMSDYFDRAGRGGV